MWLVVAIDFSRPLSRRLPLHSPRNLGPGPHKSEVWHSLQVGLGIELGLRIVGPSLQLTFGLTGAGLASVRVEPFVSRLKHTLLEFRCNAYAAQLWQLLL